MDVAERLRPKNRIEHLLGLSIALVLWIFLYQPNEPFWDWLLYDVFALDPQSPFGSGLHFFFYDTVKIVLSDGGLHPHD